MSEPCLSGPRSVSRKIVLTPRVQSHRAVMNLWVRSNGTVFVEVPYQYFTNAGLVDIGRQLIELFSPSACYEVDRDVWLYEDNEP